MGIAPERLREAVRTLASGKMRGERFERDGVTVINDCYNANPEAMRSMLELLRGTPATRAELPCWEKCWSLAARPRPCTAA